MPQKPVPASLFLESLLDHSAQSLDVRSEREFTEGNIPFSKNVPILNNQERHLVGICYKNEGNERAVALGHKLVMPKKPDLVESWKTCLGPEAFLFCWRGGQRSRITQNWLKEAGVKTERVAGGYKAIRRLLKAEFEPKSRRGLVLCGTTGVGKTRFLQTLHSPKIIDLEKIAVHRGSSFGGAFLAPQPTQQTFENELALNLMRAKGSFLMENESRLIGRCVIPSPFFEESKGYSKITLLATMPERIKNIYEDYVQIPLLTHSKEHVFSVLREALLRIRDKLGGERCSQIESELRLAFLKPSFGQLQCHAAWIESLLVVYYDPMYAYASSKRTGTELFRGNAQECREWIHEHLLKIQ